jgi:heterogeneous nuclear ribonucleoprotein A1/A3
MTKLKVSNLSPDATADSLYRLFSPFGAVQSVRLATDIMTGRCGGFGFVDVREARVGTAALALDGFSLGGRALHVALEKKRTLQSMSIESPDGLPKRLA